MFRFKGRRKRCEQEKQRKTVELKQLDNKYFKIRELNIRNKKAKMNDINNTIYSVLYHSHSVFVLDDT